MCGCGSSSDLVDKSQKEESIFELGVVLCDRKEFGAREEME